MESSALNQSSAAWALAYARRHNLFWRTLEPSSTAVDTAVKRQLRLLHGGIRAVRCVLNPHPLPSELGAERLNREDVITRTTAYYTTRLKLTEMVQRPTSLWYSVIVAEVTSAAL